jgi:acyl carrier protein
MRPEQVLPLLVRRVSEVMALDERRVGPGQRFDEDLHADSLDLVEVLEKVEADLRRSGIAIVLPDDALASVRTVQDAADRIAEHARART